MDPNALISSNNFYNSQQLYPNATLREIHVVTKWKRKFGVKTVNKNLIINK